MKMTVNQGLLIPTNPIVRLLLWYESPKLQEFMIPSSMYDNIECWVHEFTEYAIWYTLHKKFNICTHQLNSAICIKLKTNEIRRYTPCHILTSLTTTSIGKHGFMTTDEFNKMIFEERVPCPSPALCTTEGKE